MRKYNQTHMKKTYLIPFAVSVFVFTFSGFHLLEAQEAAADPEKISAVEAALQAALPNSEEPSGEPAVEPYVPDAISSGKVVKSIEIKGQKSIGVATILTKIKTRVGQEYRQNVISDDLKRLYNTGYFSDVRVDRQEEDGGFKVIIFVEEKSIVSEITFSKTRQFNKRVLLSKMKTQAGKFLDRKALRDDVGTIEEMYQKKGLSQVEVEVESVLDEATNKTRLHFIIREGYRVKVSRIKILGNSAYKDGRVIKVMKSRSAWLFNSGFLKDDVLLEDMERVQAFYEKNGYIDARADYQVIQRRRGKVDVEVTVQEGRRYYVGDIQINGVEVIGKPDIFSAMKEIKPGKVFSKQNLADDMALVKSLYFDKGYIFARVNEATSLNTQTGRVDLKMDIEEGSIAYINKIKVQGNTQTRDIVVRRELRMYPGEQFDGVKMRRSKERLNNLGYFEEVGFDIQDTDEAQKKDLVVDVREAKTGSFSFGGGYSTVDRMIGFVELEQRNFDFTNWPSLTGGGQQLSARAEVGSSRNNMVLSFTEPWIFDNPVSGGFDLYRTQYLRESSTGYAYDQTRTGTKLRLGKEINEYLSSAAYYRIENVKIGNMESNVSADLRDEVGKSTLSVIGGSLTKDKRDSTISPTTGWVLTGASDVAGGPIGGDRDFYRLETSGAYYVPFRYKSVLQFSGRVGMVDAYGDAHKVPIFERYFAGGARSIRGYDERAIGPYDSVTHDAIGGEGLITATAEYTIPLVDVIKFATFFDTGNVTAKFGDVLTDDFYSGYGIGFRVKTPIGPMNLDYGIPLNKEPGEDKRKSGKFYFSVSRGF